MVAKWGRRISLKRMSIKAPAVSLVGSHVVVKPRSSGMIVRLYSGTQFANLSRGPNGAYAADLPAEMTGPVRVAVMDAHFNVWDQAVRA